MALRFCPREGLLVTGLATFVLMGAVQALFGPSLPALGRSFAIDPATAAWLVSVQSAGSALGIGAMFLWGWQPRPRLALALMVAGTAGIAAMAGWMPVLAAGLVFGFGYGIASAVFNPRFLAFFGPRGPAMLSLLNALFGVGAIAAPLVFVGLGSDPRLAFGLAAALFAVIWLLPDRTEAAVAPPQTAAALRLRWDILAFGVVAIGLEVCLIGLGPTALIAAGLPEARAAELLSAFFLAFVVARGLLVFAASRVPPFAVYVLSMALTLLGAVGAILWPPGLFFVLIGGAAGLYFPGFFVTASRLIEAHPRSAPTILLAGLVGGISLPLIVGPLMAAMGERGFFWILSLLSGATWVVALLAWRRMR